MYGITPKAKQAASLVIACSIGIIIVLAVAVLFCPEVPPAPPQRDLISIADMQRLLNERYGAKLTIDGKLGPATQAAWDKAYNDQCAMEVWPK